MRRNIGLFGGAVFRKFGPRFVGDVERDVEQCQGGTGTADLLFRDNQCLSEPLRTFIRTAVVFMSHSLFL